MSPLPRRLRISIDSGSVGVLCYTAAVDRSTRPHPTQNPTGTCAEPLDPAISVLAWRGSDEELYERIQAGDEAAAALLYDRFARDVNRLIWRMLGADPDLDDLVSDTFLKVLESVHTVRSPDRLRSWVLSVAVNTVRSEFRKRAFRRRVLFRPVDPEAVAAAAEDPEARELLRQVFTLLEQLSADHRLAFSLRHIDGRTLPEVAELCGCSLATIKRRLARAEKRFSRLAQRYPQIQVRMEHRMSAGGDDGAV
jgi:RNA polymerase sigma-70 factor, ECF subfamily